MALASSIKHSNYILNTHSDALNFGLSGCINAENLATFSFRTRGFYLKQIEQSDLFCRWKKQICLILRSKTVPPI